MYCRKIFFSCIIYLLFHVSDIIDSFRKCKLSDPELENCVTENARIFIPSVLSGIPNLNVEPLDNFSVGNMSIKPEETGGIGMELTDVIFSHLKNTTVEFLNVDLDNKIILLSLNQNGRITISGKLYGVLFVAPIETKGELFSVDFNDTIVDYKMHYVTTEGKNGKTHWRISEHSVTYYVGSVYFSHTTTPLDEGYDRDFFPTAISIMNSNWQKVITMTKSILVMGTNKIVDSLDEILTVVSVEDMFVL